MAAEKEAAGKTFAKSKRPVILIILDGFGLRHNPIGNAVKLAKLPNFNKYRNNYPRTVLKASQEAVGLPRGFIGNSEVGHFTIGAGRLVQQDLSRINKAIEDKSFYGNAALLSAVAHVKKYNSCMHLIGLLSDGGVHSHMSHLFALMELCRKNNINDVHIHIFSDGRDVGEKTALRYIKQLRKKIKEFGIGSISTIIGRYYAMDRDNRWNREHKAYDLLVNHFGKRYKTAEQAIKDNYKKGITDEFIEPCVIEEERPYKVSSKDSVIFFNFRSDRARQLTRAFVQGTFNKFRRKKILHLKFVSMCEYDKKIKIPVAFMPKAIKNNLGQWLSRNKKKQLRIAETEKYAHVTYFFNSAIENPNPGEDRILIPSPKVPTYDLTPEMSAPEITKKAVKEISRGKYDFVLLNFANPDMVGHTGLLRPTIKAVEAVDGLLGKVVNAVLERNGTAVITADHGNCEEMIGKHKKSHTLNKVPFIIISNKPELQRGKIKLRESCLYDVAPTVLKLMNMPKPDEMTGESLVVTKC